MPKLGSHYESAVTTNITSHPLNYLQRDVECNTSVLIRLDIFVAHLANRWEP